MAEGDPGRQIKMMMADLRTLSRAEELTEDLDDWQ